MDKDKQIQILKNYLGMIGLTARQNRRACGHHCDAQKALQSIEDQVTNALKTNKDEN